MAQISLWTLDELSPVLTRPGPGPEKEEEGQEKTWTSLARSLSIFVTQSANTSS